MDFRIGFYQDGGWSSSWLPWATFTLRDIDCRDQKDTCEMMTLSELSCYEAVNNVNVVVDGCGTVFEITVISDRSNNPTPEAVTEEQQNISVG